MKAACVLEAPGDRRHCQNTNSLRAASLKFSPKRREGHSFFLSCFLVGIFTCDSQLLDFVLGGQNLTFVLT